ncbi:MULTISPECIES: hypothetical protein [Vibrio]|nr:MULTISPECIES: hypothetical protein [Vibrio]MBO0208528.1 hypothetical protein [Vibrio sp. Vb0877]MCR9809179.1 hypothetical protein [Vibrio parahaemolyticus]MDW2323168.1 hypothetical protein [Vibrio sp. 1159]
MATGVDGKIGLDGKILEEQKSEVLRVVITVLMEISEKICPEQKLYGRN